MRVTNHTGNGGFQSLEIRPDRQLEALVVELTDPDGNVRQLPLIYFTGDADEAVHQTLLVVNLTVPEVMARYQWYRIHRDREEPQFVLVHDTLGVDVNRRFEANRLGRPARYGPTPMDAIRQLFPQSLIRNTQPWNYPDFVALPGQSEDQIPDSRERGGHA